MTSTGDDIRARFWSTAPDDVKLLREFVDQTTIGVVLLDDDGDWLYANPVFCALTGYSEAECVGLKFNDLLHRDDREDAKSRLDQFLRGDTGAYQAEYRIYRKDGSLADVRANFSRLNNAETSIRVRHILQIADITAQKNAETALKTAEQHWNHALQGSHQVVWDFDIPSGMVQVSPQWKALLDLPDDERIHPIDDWLSKMHPDDRDRMAEATERDRVSGNLDFDAVYRLRHTDGRWIWVLSRGRMVEHAPDGTGIRMIGTIIDITREKEMEVRLAAVTERLEIALEAGGIGSFDVDFVADQYHWDKRTCELHGVTPNEFDRTRAGFARLIHPEDAARVELTRASAFQQASGYQLEYRVRRKSADTFRHIRASVRLVRGNDGKVLRGLGVCWDITDDVERTRHLQETLALLDAVMSGTPDLIFAKDHDGRYLLANKSVERVMGLSGAQILGKDDAKIFPPDIAQPLIKNDRYILETGEAYTVEETAIVNGVLRTFSSTKVPRLNELGEIIGLIGISRDVTDVRTAQEALRQSELRWQFALDGSGDGIWDWDWRTGQVYYSSQWKAMLGYGDEDIGCGVNEWSDRVHPDDLPHCWEIIEKHFSGNTPDFALEHRMRAKDGTWRWIFDRGKVIERSASGEPLRVIGTHSDITERKESEAAIIALNQRLQLAIKASGAGIFDLDFTTELFGWDDRMYALYDLPMDGFDGKLAGWLDFIHPDDAPGVLAGYEAAVNETSVFSMDFRIHQQRSGHIRHIRSLARIHRDEKGKPIRAIGMNWDITDHKELADTLFEQKEQLRITLHSIGDAVIATNAHAQITFMNPVAEQMTGWPASEAMGHVLPEIFHLVDEKGRVVPNPIEICLKTKQPFYLEGPAFLVSRTGERRDVRDSAAPVRTATGEITGAVLVFQDVTKARALQQALEHSATHDSLTGLPNRAGFERQLSEALEQAQQDGREHTLCFIDLDRFKLVNDGAGHAAGDALLRKVAGFLRHNGRSQDTAARLGGDEFALLLRDCPISEGEIITSRFLENLARYRFVWDGRTFGVGASIGLTSITQAAPPLDVLLSQADIACYAAKSAGRNRISVYGDTGGSALRHHREIQVASDIRSAIETNRFRLFAQEIRNLKAPATAVHHFEILLRMEDEAGALIEPNLFIPAAEHYDLMGTIDRWVIKTSLRAYGSRLCAVPDLSIAINLSANSLSDPFLWPFLREELDVSALPPNRLHFEIAETALINNVSAARLFLSNVRAAGCKVILDDFGNGLSSFNYLREFPVDGIKIDGGFIRGMTSSEVDRTIVESINAIGHRLGVITIAEQVEDNETFELIYGMGIDQAQGFAIARPQPLDILLGEGPRVDNLE